MSNEYSIFVWVCYALFSSISLNGSIVTWQLSYLIFDRPFVMYCSEFSKEDMAKSLLHMISNDIGQLACLYAKLHNLTRVYFGGFFIRGHPVTMHTITYSINFFTKVSRLFLYLFISYVLMN